jgi:hypothetical protein
VFLYNAYLYRRDAASGRSCGDEEKGRESPTSAAG